MKSSNLVLIKSNLKKQLSDIDEALLMLDSVIKVDSSCADELLQFGYIREDMRRLRGTVDQQEDQRQRNELRFRLTEFINSLREEDLNDQPQCNILVICPDEPGKTDMESYFGKLPLKADVVVAAADLALDSYQLIVFDNRQLPDMPGRDQVRLLDGDEKQSARAQFELMKHVLATSSKYVVHFGERSFLVNEYREKVHAANSKFALYARIEEVIDYMRTTQELTLHPIV